MTNDILDSIPACDLHAVLKAGAALSEPRVLSGKGNKPFVIVPEGFNLQTTPEVSLPDRPNALVKLRDARSFVTYFNDHKVERSRVYALLQPAKFLAVFDDFDTSAKTGDTDEQADWRDFRAVFDVPASKEWTTWTGAHKKQMTQLEFAEFLLDNMPDVVKPPGSEL